MPSHKIEEVREKRKERVAAVRSEINRKAAKRKAPNPNTVTSNRLQVMVTVVNKNKSEFFADLLQSFDVNLQVVAAAQGTADERMRSYFGLADTDRAVIFSVIQENKLPEALNALEEKFNSIKGGKGIAFTIPFSSVIGTSVFGFLANNRQTVKEEK